MSDILMLPLNEGDEAGRFSETNSRLGVSWVPRQDGEYVAERNSSPPHL
jgi:hypothetical protein